MRRRWRPGNTRPTRWCVDAPVSIGNWSPQNYGRSYKGRLTLRDALTQSLNTVAVRLSIATGRQPIADLAARMGVVDAAQSHPLAAARQLGGDRARPGDRLFRVRQRRLPRRAARADRCAHHRRRRRLRRHRESAAAPARAAGIDRARHDRHDAQPWSRTAPARRARLPGINVAGKTGTTNAYRDAWFVGFTGNFTTARLARQRQLRADQPADRRHPAGGDLGEIHARRHGLREADPAPRPAAAGGDRRAARRRRRRAASGRFDPGASGRLAPETSDALGRLEERFKKATRSARRCSQAALDAERARPSRRRDVRSVVGSAHRRSLLRLALGLWSAWLAVRSPAPIDTITLGAWQAWPNAGTADADPYSRARLARTGEIPLGSGEGLMLLALTDDARRRRSSRLRLHDRRADAAGAALDGRAREPGRACRRASGTSVAALGSDTLLREPDGSFEIALSPRPQGGNWISTDEAERFRVVVRLYDTTARTGTELTTLAMPRHHARALRMIGLEHPARLDAAAAAASAASCRFATGALLAAGAIHICAILLVPSSPKADGWSRLAPHRRRSTSSPKCPSPADGRRCRARPALRQRRLPARSRRRPRRHHRRRARPLLVASRSTIRRARSSSA